MTAIRSTMHSTKPSPSRAGCTMHHQHPKYLVPKNLFYSSQQHANYPTGQSNNTRFGAWGQHLRKRAFSRITCSASSTTSAAPTPTPQPPAGVEYDFACPICLTSRLTVTRFANSSTSAHLCCTRCQRTFADAGTYVDLTLTSGATPRVYGQELSQTSVQLFRNPLVSFVYERGWRQGFASAGFPGPDVEFAAALEYLKPTWGGTLIDLSCGSGLFTRRFIKSGQFKKVIAADFSETMLQQTQQYIRDDFTIPPTSYCLVRCDAARLPFESGSVDAIHAGAAIHCWPQPQVAMAEISRVLRPGGVFVGTTFMGALAPLGEVLGEDVVRPVARVVDPMLDPRRRSGMKAWEETELQEITGAAGLVDFSRKRQSRYDGVHMGAYRYMHLAPFHTNVNRYIMFSARKPNMTV